MKPDMKTISYRGGIVRFSVPSNWVEEYEPEGGGTFYEDRPDSGTLRLNVLSFESPKPAAEMASSAFKQDPTEMLSSGFLMRRSIKSAVESGEALSVHRWEIAVPVPPNSLRLVCFSHTILAAQERDAEIVAELRLLDDSIRAAEFSQQPGVGGSFVQ